jgi:hypothetical protein
MKDCSQALLDLIPSPKSIGARATFRVARPQFEVSQFTAPGAYVSNSSLLDTCAYGTGILRVLNYNGTLHTQEVPDVHAANWPSWTNTGIALMAGSRPGVDAGYVWYQKANGLLYYRDYSNWTTENIGRGDGDGVAEILAPIRNERCYSMYVSGDRISIDVGIVSALGTFWRQSPVSVYGVTSPVIDAVNFSNDNDTPVDYLYFTNRDAGRIMEMRTIPDDDSVSWGQPRPIIAIDAIDEVYGLKLYGAEVINSKVVVTGRLTRTSDGNPVSMDIYTFGPDDFSLGRDMFISQTSVGGKIVVVGDELVAAGGSYCATAIGTYLFGVDSPACKLVSSDIGHVQLQEAENRSSTVSMSLSPDISHIALNRGAHVEIEVAYNDEWINVLTGEVAGVTRTRGEGQSLTVRIANLTAKRLSQWSPDQGVYIPSQSYAICRASDLSKVIRADGTFSPGSFAASEGKYDDTDSLWQYVGTWGTDTPSGAYNNTIHYNNASYPDDYATIDFVGTSFEFTFTKYVDRGVHDIWIDGVLYASVNAYSATKVQGTYTSPVLEPGLHTFKVSHGYPVSGYIDVDAIEVFGSATIFDGPMSPVEYNKLTVLYTAARASRGGIMRAKFWYEEAITGVNQSLRNQRFGVGLNYYRESKVEAAARLGLDYNDVTDDLCGHNGLVAIFSHTERYGGTGFVLYKWENSVLTPIATAMRSFGGSSRYVWMQIKFIEGLVTVSIKNDLGEWIDVLTHVYNRPSPWVQEEGGRGCVVMEKQLLQSTSYYGFSDADAAMAVDNNGLLSLPCNVLVDDEIIAIDGKSTYNVSVPTQYTTDWQVRFTPAYRQYSGFNGTRVIVNVPVDIRGSYPDHSFQGAALMVNPGTPGYPHTMKIVDFDCDAIDVWSPTPYSSGWSTYVGQSGHGSWIYSGMSAFCVENYPFNFLRTSGEMDDDEASYVKLKPAYWISERGVNGTTASAHEAGLAYAYYDLELNVDDIEFYSQEEDITLADALRRVVCLAGGKITERHLIDEIAVVGDHFFLGSDWQVLDIDDGKKDFIAEIHLPTTVPQGQQVKVGVGFYGSISLSTEFDEGYYLCVEDDGLALYGMDGDPLTLIEKVYPSVDRFCGTLRVSVQDNRFSVWLDHKLLHVFYSDTLASEAYQYKAFIVHNPLEVTLPDMRFVYSELNDLMADIVVGTRGKGMAILGELTNNRRVYFRSEPDGSLLFYKTPESIGALPDIVISEQHEQADELVSRVRAEGIKVAEMAHMFVLWEHGNLFETANSVYAETVQDLVSDGNQLVELLYRRSDTRSLETVFHPALQPGDVGTIDIAGEEVEIGVMATSVSFGFNGDNFDVVASVEVYDNGVLPTTIPS